jgi:hypothetical protein
MSIAIERPMTARRTHRWLRRINAAFVPGPVTPMLEEVATNMANHFRSLGHRIQSTPDDETDVILTTADFGEPVDWRQCLTVTARRRFGLNRTPAVWTLVRLPVDKFRGMIDRFRDVLAKEPPDPADYDFPGLAPQAYRVLFEQGRRGGPILALQRLIQAQAKSIRVILVVGDEQPLAAYHFDLVGAYPRSEARDLEAFYDDIVLRIVTTLSTYEVNKHEAVGERIPYALWQNLTTPAAMVNAGQHLGKRDFFTDMVRITDLVQVPVVEDVIASQYSEGCYSSWDPELGALIATVTGSARPVDKGNITEDDLAVIVGVRPDGKGALLRHVDGKSNDPPSSESVEMMDIDDALPTITLDLSDGTFAEVPVVRSKLHGHRGISVYDPSQVEYVPLDQPFYYYLVSCATGAQAEGIKQAFARSEALRNPNDPRQVAFTVLPGHGVVIAEKWVPGKDPFQTIWEYMDVGYLVTESRVPQGPMTYAPDRDGNMVLQHRDNGEI